VSGSGSIDPAIGKLLGLAQTATAESRGELFLSITDLMRDHRRQRTANEDELLLAILKQLTRQVETEVRQALAERLAERDDVPADLILLLANDRIEVARALLLRSPILSEEDLIGLVRATTAMHQNAIAQRPDIGPRLAGTIAEVSPAETLLILLANQRAELGELALRRIVDRARNEPELQKPALQRPEMPQDLARRMCAFVSDALLSFISQRFAVDAAAIRDELRKAETDAHAKLTGSSGPARLVEKLFAAGQLKPAFVMKALAQGQIDLFEHAAARLLGVEQAGLHRILRNGDPLTLAAVCHAAGIDRSAFPTVYQQSETLRGRAGILGLPDRQKSDKLFGETSREDARAMIIKKAS
jgi:uncharacterized protein (DUF2336 family)